MLPSVQPSEESGGVGKVLVAPEFGGSSARLELESSTYLQARVLCLLTVMIKYQQSNLKQGGFLWTRRWRV